VGANGVERSVGEVVGGKYRLERLLGEGGMGAVWRATHIELESPVAIKLIRPTDDQPDRTARFLREAKAAAAVRHRNVVAITDFGSDHGLPFMVMELLEGVTLASRLASGPPLTFSELVGVVSGCLSGLAAVHDAKIVHGDLKPENVFLVEDADGSFPKLLDFGVSRATPEGDRNRGAVTGGEGGWLVGTPHFMSPEQARGAADIDRRSDIYAVGVMLYEALTGKLPYDGATLGELIVLITRGGAPPLSTVRGDLGQAMSDVVAKAMARERNERFPSAREMRAQLLQAARAVPSYRAPEPGEDTGRFVLERVERRAREAAPTIDAAIPITVTLTQPRPNMPSGRSRLVASSLAVVIGLAVLGSLGAWAAATALGGDPAPHAAAAPSSGPAPAPVAAPATVAPAAPPQPAAPVAVASTPTAPEAPPTAPAAEAPPASRRRRGEAERPPAAADPAAAPPERSRTGALGPRLMTDFEGME
jgi:serine/threonine-protein kinase